MQGDYDNGSSTSSVIVITAVDPVYFITASESYFLQAEAAIRYMGGTNAKELYEMGVTAAFSKYELDAADLLAGNYAYPDGSDEANIEAVIVQKWVSCFPGNGFESFFEQNRTGYPQISNVEQDSPLYVSGQLSYSITGKTGGLFPARFAFPLEERQRNTNAPAANANTDKVWYDIN